MATPITIVDKDGNTPKVVDEGLVVTRNPVLAPASKDFTQVPFVMNLAVDGDGAIDLRQDGSTTAIDAFIEARSDGDLYIEIANLFIEGAGNIDLNQFGGIAALTNGIETFVESEGTKIPITQVPILTNIDMIRIGTLTQGLGEDATAFRGKQALGVGNTFYNPVWDLTKLSSGNEGIVLAAGTNQRLGITINDDLTGVALTAFNIIMIGYVRLI